MKVLHFFDHSVPLHSGYTFRSLAILNAQRRRGWETEHITSAKQGAFSSNPESTEGLRFHRTEQSSALKLPILGQMEVIRTLTKSGLAVASAVKPDVLHAHSPSLCGWAAQRVGARLGIPVVYEIRAFWEDAAVDMGKSREGDLKYRLTKTLETRLLDRVNGITCICTGLKNDLISRGISADRITEIGNSIDAAKFPPLVERDEALAKRLGVEDSPVLGFIGSFYAYEGLDLLLQSMSKIASAIPKVKLLLVGGGERDAYLKQMTIELGLTDRVIFTGRVPHSEVNAYSSLVSAFVFPRKKMRLTDLVTPLKPLEAMAQHRLVLASDVGGHQELITQGRTGFLFQNGSTESLATEAIKVLKLSEPEKQIVLSKAYEFILAERSWDTTAARYVQVYDKALNHFRQSRA
jgi:PEP-CTERM/exosortase A-associated glycosyltransferase